MPMHSARIVWHRGGGDFLGGKYSRGHRWQFDGGLEVPASPSPAIIPAPHSDPGGVDPEEALVASLSSCHMLSFLHLAQKAGLCVERYEDEAQGELTKREDGVWWLSRITLRPRVQIARDAPAQVSLDDLHHRAHALCFIANSVKTEVRVEPSTLQETAVEPRSPEITGYHAHIYYDAASREKALRIREQLQERFDVRLGRMRDEPVGPHVAPMFQVAFGVAQLSQVLPWLALHHGNLSVLIHPLTGDDLHDHTTHAMWLGQSLGVYEDRL